MRKKSMILILILLCMVLISGSAYAVQGPCVNCHTMHNSQNGTPMTADGNTHSYLLLASCIGCHTGSFQATTIPKVDKTTSILAGGSLNTSVANAKSKRHDITDLFTGGDDSYGANPTPGYAAAETNLLVSPTELRCAGSKGCHGRHSTPDPDAGIKGFHHASVSNAGYRFLWLTTSDPGTSITGKGVSGYEANGATSSSHNVYSADATIGISRLCGECHGDFHGTADTNASSPFIRHPTDRVMGGGGAGWTWNSFDWGNQTAPYDNTPVAFTDMSTIATNTAYFGSDNGTIAAVMCLSCHRAHGSANADILRWAYDVSAGSGLKEKCLACHYKQR